MPFSPSSLFYSSHSSARATQHITHHPHPPELQVQNPAPLPPPLVLHPLPPSRSPANRHGLHTQVGTASAVSYKNNSSGSNGASPWAASPTAACGSAAGADGASAMAAAPTATPAAAGCVAGAGSACPTCKGLHNVSVCSLNNPLTL